MRLLLNVLRWSGILIAVAGVLLIIVSPWMGPAIWKEARWGVEPPAYIGAIVMVAGLVVALAAGLWHNGPDPAVSRSWSRITQDYFDTFSHDMGRPLRRILGKQREVRARLEEPNHKIPDFVIELLDEIEHQAPSFRVMLANVRVLVELEDPDAGARWDPLDPGAVVRNVVDRYQMVAAERDVDVSWWCEPQEFGLVYGDPSSLDHIVTNLVDNATKYASHHVEVRLTRNPTHYYVRVWDDGPGIIESHRPHIFDRGWTPELAARAEKSSSGLGLFIARTLARRSGGEVIVASSTGTGEDAEGESLHFTMMTVMLPLQSRQAPSQ